MVVDVNCHVSIVPTKSSPLQKRLARPRASNFPYFRVLGFGVPFERGVDASAAETAAQIGRITLISVLVRETSRNFFRVLFRIQKAFC